MTKITRQRNTYYIHDTKNNANKCSNACCTFNGFPRDFILNTTDASSTTIGGQVLVNLMFISIKETVV